MALFARATLLIGFIFCAQVDAAVISQGVKLKVSKFRIENKKTFFRHKKHQFVYPSVLKIDKEKEIFFTFDELQILMRENKIALGGVAGGGGGK